MPTGAETADTSGTRDRSAAYLAISASGTPLMSGMTTLTAVAESLAKSLRNWSPTWRAEAESGSTRSSGKPHRTPRNGVPTSNSSATTASPMGSARRMTNFVERYQNCLLDGLADRLRAAEHAARQPAHVQRIQPVPEQHDGRGRDHDRRDRGERDGGDSRVAERLQEVHREQDHRGHRQRDRRRREQHRAARGGHGADERVVAGCAGGHLVAEPADDEQRVVDRQGQAQRGGEVEREDRHVGGERDQPQHRERAQDRHPADGDRQRGGEQAAEHPDQHQEAERNGDRLHQQHVVLRLLGDLRVDHREAAGPHGDAVAVVGELMRTARRRTSASRSRRR